MPEKTIPYHLNTKDGKRKAILNFTLRLEEIMGGEIPPPMQDRILTLLDHGLIFVFNSRTREGHFRKPF